MSDYRTNRERDDLASFRRERLEECETDLNRLRIKLDKLEWSPDFSFSIAISKISRMLSALKDRNEFKL